MTSMNILQFSGPPTPLVPSLPFQMITNQLKESTIQGWLLYVIRSFLQVDFRFQYQLINLVWLSFDFFSFSWSLTICFFVALHYCACSCPILFIIIHIFGIHFPINLFLLAQLENVSKLWNNNPTVHVNEQNQYKKKLRHIQIDYAFYCSI